MCGIVGILSAGQSDSSLGKIILSQLTHRGPDSAYAYSEKKLFLGIRRLAIINVEDGAQPSFSGDGDIVAIFNGEIYNHRELKRELTERGYKIANGSDAEIIPHAYREWGLDFVTHFNGDFAIAVWDRKKQELVLARDRMGIKPLYYTQAANGDFLFASEIKSFFVHPNVKPALNFKTLSQIFTFWTPVDGSSAFDGINQVEAGTICRFNTRGECLQKLRYWDIPFAAGVASISKNFDECKTLFQDELRKSIRLRLQADVEVGTYTSGGIDSAVIAYMTYKDLGHKNTQTFSVAFDDPLLDEEKYQKLVTNNLQLNANTVKITNRDIYEQFRRTIYHTEAPLFRTAPVPMGILSKLVRDRGIKVILTGEGSDEVIWGYDIYRETRVRRFWSRQPNSKIRPMLFQRMYHYLPQFQDKRYFNLTVDFFKTNFDKVDDPLYSHALRIINSSSAHSYFSEHFKKTLIDEHPLETLRASLPADYNNRSFLEKCQFLEMKTLLGGYLLSSQGDRMVSSNGVEGRFPYLDHNFVEFMAKVPENFKLCGLKDKHILRETFKDKLPKELVYRSKHAYRAPEMTAFADDPDGYVEDLFKQERIEEVGVFDPKAVRSLFMKLKNKKTAQFTTRDNLAFTQILSTQVLHDIFIKNFAAHIQPLQRDIIEIKSRGQNE